MNRFHDEQLEDFAEAQQGDGGGCQQGPCSAGPLTAEMIREMLGHVPLSVGEPPARWEWMANYLNQTLRNPGAMCPCCNITRRGELMDHLPSPPLPSLPND